MTNGSEQPFEDWLTEKIEENREVYKDGPRSENPRQTYIAFGRLRAFRNARTRYLNRTLETDNEQ